MVFFVKKGSNFFVNTLNYETSLSVIPAEAGIQSQGESGSIAGFPPEFILAQAGAGMTI